MIGPNLIIEICPNEGRASPCTMDGASVAESDFAQDLLDCVKSGDAEPACQHVLDQVGVEFRIVARDAAGVYENRLATAAEKAATCRAIYFDSESDFDDEGAAEMYLVWQAAADFESEEAEA